VNWYRYRPTWTRLTRRDVTFATAVVEVDGYARTELATRTDLRPRRVACQRREGFAGSRHLTLAGMVWFAAAHTLFFVVLAVLYARLRGQHTSRDV
jgi:hypothetical protein